MQRGRAPTRLTVVFRPWSGECQHGVWVQPVQTTKNPCGFNVHGFPAASELLGWSVMMILLLVSLVLGLGNDHREALQARLVGVWSAAHPGVERVDGGEFVGAEFEAEVFWSGRE